MEMLTERLVIRMARFAATVMLFGGASVFVAGIPLIGTAMELPLARRLGVLLFQLGGMFVVGSVASLYLSRWRDLPLPNERTAPSGAERPPLGGWLMLLAIALVALPVWLFLNLQPFLTEWRRVLSLLTTSGLWDGASANGSGLVLLPLAVALTPPAFELAAAAAFPVASGALSALLLSRSARFPRMYLVYVLLLTTLVIVSLRAAVAATRARDEVQTLIDASKPRPEEAAQLQEGLDRYARAVSTTAPLLAWTCAGYLLWVPAMFYSERVRSTFANRTADPGRPLSVATDIEAITRPPHFPG
jgi:hypothetical protein